MATGRKTLTLLLVGKTGNGKSTTGNSIVEAVEGATDKAFSTGAGFTSCTTELEQKECSGDMGRVKVINTPDLNLVQSAGKVTVTEEDKQQVETWLKAAGAGAGPDAVVLVVRADCRYTQEEFQIYEKLKKLLEDQMKKGLVVAFTMGDCLNGRDLRVDLDHASKELKEVLKDARGRYVVFDNRAELADRTASVRALLEIVETKVPHPFPQNVCRLLLLGDATKQREIAQLLCPEENPKDSSENFFFSTMSAELPSKFHGLKIEVALTLHGGEDDDAVLRAISPGPHVVIIMAQDDKVLETLDEKYSHYFLVLTFRKAKNILQDLIVNLSSVNEPERRKHLLVKVKALVTSNKGRFHRSQKMTDFAEDMQDELSRKPRATYQDLLALKSRRSK